MRRRAFLGGGLAAVAGLAATGLLPRSEAWLPPGVPGPVADLHTGLDRARPARILHPRSVEDVQDMVRAARRAEIGLCAAGRRHSSGGQPLVDGGWMLDMTGLGRVRDVDNRQGVLVVEAGAQWPAVTGFLARHAPTWTIRQKQTIPGLTLGGTVASNAHGNGLHMGPIADDVAWLEVIDAEGTSRRCSRELAPDLFRATVGGYGLLGVVTTIGLRLSPRRKFRTLADFVPAAEVASALADRAGEGAVYGSCTLSMDASAADFMRQGLLLHDTPDDLGQAEPAPSAFDEAQWMEQARRLHDDPGAAWRHACSGWLAMTGRTWWAEDLLMAGGYVEGYHEVLDRSRGKPSGGCDVITEFLLPPAELGPWLERMRARLLRDRVLLLLCEIRRVGADRETLLGYAPTDLVGAAMAIHVDGDAAARATARRVLRQGLEDAISRGGSFHPAFSWSATPGLLRAALPRLAEWLAVKRTLDPEGRFRSRWHDTRLLPAALGHS